jgi:hypothetical protein
MGLRDTLRKMAADRNGPVMMVPVLNDPTKQIALPVAHRDEILAAFRVTPDQVDLVQAIFVKEGLAIGFWHRVGGEGAGQFILHAMDLRDERDIEAAGSEIYDMWKAFPELLSYGQLQENWREWFKEVAAKVN